MTPIRLLVAALLLQISFSAAAQAPYRINPGDVLLVFVWNEKDLTQEILVRPDGLISLPLAGQLMAGGLTPAQVEKSIAEGLSKYLKDKPSVTVALKQIAGHKIYVLGKVNRPGEFPISRPTDVMQALALAGGLNAFAAENSIMILRRDKDGQQTAIPFEYGDVKDGENLPSNILLESGDVVVVP
jgi:polysaccharide biosynthesis/export protein